MAEVTFESIQEKLRRFREMNTPQPKVIHSNFLMEDCREWDALRKVVLADIKRTGRDITIKCEEER